MEKIKKAVGEQLVDIETAIVEALSIKEVKLYVTALTTITKISNELVEKAKEAYEKQNASEEEKEHFKLLKEQFKLYYKKIALLEAMPQVKAYLALFPKHAYLADSYKELSSVEASPSR